MMNTIEVLKMARWIFDLIPHIGPLPVRFGMTLVSISTELGLLPGRLIDEGNGYLKVNLGEIATVFTHLEYGMLGASFGLFGDKVIKISGRTIIKDERWVDDIESYINELGNYEIIENRREFSSFGLSFPLITDNENTSDQWVSIRAMNFD